MKKMIRNEIGAWLRGLVWTAMIAGCAWASAQSYLVTPPAGGHYHTVAMGTGEGVGLGEGIGAAGAQNAEPIPKDDLFAGTEVFAKNATHVTEITMDPDTLNMVGGPDEHKARSMVLNVVRSYSYDKPGMYNVADVDAFRNKLNTGDWHCSIHTRDLKTGDGSDVCGKRRTDGLKEQVIIEVSPTHLTFIHTIRRGNGPGTSEVGFFPMLPGLSGLPSIAMMDPEVFADMQIGLADMQVGLSGMPFMYATPGAHVFTFDSKDMKDLDKLKDLKIKPMDPEQKQQMKREFRYRIVPDEDAAPAAPPAPAAPKAAPAPQAAPAPAPQAPQ